MRGGVRFEYWGVGEVLVCVGCVCSVGVMDG